MEKLYEEYGKLMVQQELLQNRINEVKRRIAEGLNQPKEEVKSNKE